MPKTKNPPTGGKGSQRGKPRWIIAVAAVAILSIGAAAWTMRSAADPAAAAAKDQQVTLDPARFSGAARQAYEVAAKNPALLAQLHCYCGCDKEIGHQNLLDCYRDEHGGHCPVCTGEALEASKLADEGLPVEQIRRVLRDHYAQGN
jgi:hypothetical protein